MQCLPYLQGMPPAYKVFFAGAREDYILFNETKASVIVPGLQAAGQSDPFHALPVGRQIARITNE